jgi:hypothetical protein
MQERRQAPRARTLKSGKIIFKMRRTSIECTIRNLSDRGALLIVSNLALIPESFELELEATRVRYDCRVKWRGEDRLGVEFV